MTDFEKIPLNGELCRGAAVTLNWPTEKDLDSLTSLRNRPGTRKWFLDDRKICNEASNKWIREMPRPAEALLVIRGLASGVFLGSIGWTDWNTTQGTATFGRLALDHNGLRCIAQEGTAPFGIAEDAAIALRNFAFSEMRLNSLDTWYAADNTLAAKVNSAVGMEVIGPDTLVRPNGQNWKVLRAKLTRARWIEVCGGACRT